MTNHASHISIQVGPQFEDAQTSISVKALINSQAAQQQLENLQKLTGGNLDTEWGFVVSIKTLDGKAQELQNKITQIHNELFGEEDFQLKTYVEASQLWLSYILKPEPLEEVKEGFNMVLAQGLDEFADKTENVIQLSLSSNNDFTFASEQIKKGDRWMSVVMKSLKFVLSLDLAPNLAATIKQVLENIEPYLANDPSMKLLLKFKNLKLDLEFKGSDDCPEFIRQNGFYGKRLQKWLNEGQVALEEEQFIGLLKLLQDQQANSEAEFYFTIPGFVAVSGSAKLPGVAQFGLDFGGVLDKI